MSEVTIRITNISDLSNSLHEMQRDLNRISENIRTIRNGLTDSSFRIVRTKLTQISENTQNVGTLTSTYADTLQECARIYLRAETESAGLSDEETEKTIKDVNIDGYDSDIKKWIEENGEDILKVIFAGVPVGKFGFSIYDLIAGGDGSASGTASNVLKFTKEGLSVLSKIAKGAPDGFKEILKQITGLTTYTLDGATASSTFLEKLGLALGDELSKYKLNTGAAETGGSAASWLGTVAKWAGVVVEGVTEGIENYNEFKDSGNWGRMIGETILEGGTDIGLGIGASAVIGALLAGTGAPVIAVVAAGAGVVYLANKGCEWVTEKFFGEAKDIGEVVSDLVIDGGKAVINTISDGVSNVVNGIQNTADAIGRGLDQIGSSISALFAW